MNRDPKFGRAGGDSLLGSGNSSGPHGMYTHTHLQGKPLTEAMGEIAYSASFFEWYAGEARRLYGQIVPANLGRRQHFHYREPSGVAAVITPVRV